MPNGNNLMAGRTSVGVSGDTRPQYGLPYQRLPGTAQTTVTPESRLKREIRMGQKQIQNQFDLQWKAINQSSQFVGQGKTNRLLQQLHTKAKQDMLTFNQKAKIQMDQLRGIDRLVEQGMVGQEKANYLKAYQAYGPQTARAMYPDPEKEEDIMKMFGRLDVYGDKLAEDRAQFRIIGESIPEPPSKWLGFLGPLMGGPAMTYAEYRYRKKLREPGKKGELQWWNPNIPVKVPEIVKGKKTGIILDEMGDWEKVESRSVKAAAYEFILSEEKAVAGQKTELQKRLGIGRRIVQPGATKGGTFNDGIAEAIRGPAVRQPTRQLRQPGQPIFSDPLGLRQ